MRGLGQRACAGGQRRLALGVLRRLTGLLQTGLLALLDPRVAGQEAGLLQRRAVALGSISFSARAMPRRSAPAWPERPPPVILAITSYGSEQSRVTNGSLMSCWCTLFGKYSSSVRPLIVHGRCRGRCARGRSPPCGGRRPRRRDGQDGRGAFGASLGGALGGVARSARSRCRVARRGLRCRPASSTVSSIWLSHGRTALVVF